jgi:hypothetical protein
MAWGNAPGHCATNRRALKARFNPFARHHELNRAFSAKSINPPYPWGGAPG